MAKDKERFYSRKFLNSRDDGGMAAVEAVVSTSEREDSFCINSHFSIADCNRKATLEFEVYDYGTDLKGNLKDLRARQKKLQAFKVSVEGFIATLEEVYDEMESKLPSKIEAAKKAAEKEKAKKNR